MLLDKAIFEYLELNEMKISFNRKMPMAFWGQSMLNVALL
jgi:hypothetical protein